MGHKMRAKVDESVEWLLRVRDRNVGGWGMFEESPVRIVTTAEAVVALLGAGVPKKDLVHPLDYLRKSAENPEWCKYLRHHAWVSYAFSRANEPEQIPSRCLQALKKPNRDGGWSHNTGTSSSVFATFLAMRSLQALETGKNQLASGYDWLIKNRHDNHWRLTDNKPSVVATAYALLVLMNSGQLRELLRPITDDAADFLVNNKERFWTQEIEPYVAGDGDHAFHHITAPWVIMAFCSRGVSLADSILAQSADHLFDAYYSEGTGGWSEEPDHRPSVFATAHVLEAHTRLSQTLSVDGVLAALRPHFGRVAVDQRKGIFIVHGHDIGTREEVARFVEKLGHEPIIMSEQILAGTTTLFQGLQEQAKRAGYAIILLTPDDLVGENTARARQNVVLELGFFLSKLGADRICLAKKGNVEIPSDVEGVLYLDLGSGSWKFALAEKLKAAGFKIDLNKVTL